MNNDTWADYQAEAMGADYFCSAKNDPEVSKEEGTCRVKFPVEKLFVWRDRAHESSVRVLIAMRNVMLNVDKDCSTKTIEREMKNFQHFVGVFLKTMENK